MKLKIEVEVSDAFVEEEVSQTTKQFATMEEKQDFVINKYMSGLYRAMANHATKEMKEQAEAQIRMIETQAMAQAKELVIITKDETTA